MNSIFLFQVLVQSTLVYNQRYTRFSCALQMFYICFTHVLHTFSVGYVLYMLAYHLLTLSIGSILYQHISANVLLMFI